VTRYVVDAGVVVHLVTEGIAVADRHTLLAPTLLRSQVLSQLHEAVAGGRMAPDVGLARLRAAWALPIRLLGDAVLRRRAWDIATELGWSDTFAAEYLALTQIQARAYVTMDEDLVRRAAGIVTCAPVDPLR
jgi:hypothetical protein